MATSQPKKLSSRSLSAEHPSSTVNNDVTLDEDKNILAIKAYDSSLKRRETTGSTTSTVNSTGRPSILLVGGENAQWQDDKDTNNCTSCMVEFDFFIRRHHCRACGKIFCAKCCSRFAPVEGFDYLVRVCDYCILTQKSREWTTQNLPSKSTEDKESVVPRPFEPSDRQKRPSSSAKAPLAVPSPPRKQKVPGAPSGRSEPSDVAQLHLGVLEGHTRSSQATIPITSWLSDIIAPKAVTEDSVDDAANLDGLEPADEGDEATYKHRLARASSISRCHGCFNAWTDSGKFASTSHNLSRRRKSSFRNRGGCRCLDCHREFHVACRYIASECVPCEPVESEEGSQYVPQTLLENFDLRAMFGTINVVVHRAKNLKVRRWDFGTQDPFVKLSICPRESDAVRTQPQVAGGRNPVWGKMQRNSLSLKLPFQAAINVKAYVLIAEVWNSNMLSDSLLGRATVDLLPALLNPTKVLVKWHPLNLDEVEIELSGESKSLLSAPKSDEEEEVPAEEPKKGKGKANSEASLLLSISFSPDENVFGCDWTTHTMELTTFWKESGCNSCGHPMFGILPQGFHCNKCRINTHVWCRTAAERDFSCRPQFLSVTGQDPLNCVGKNMGVLFVVLKSIHRCGKDCTTFFHARGDNELRSYASLEFEDHSLKTPDCLNDGRPNLNSQVAYVVREKRSAIKIDVRDASSHKSIGTSELSLFDIQEEQAMMAMGTFPTGVAGPFHLHPDPGGEWRLLRNDKREVTGYVQVKTYFLPNFRYFFQQKNTPTEPNFSLEEMKINFARLMRIINFFKEVSEIVKRIFAWENYFVSGSLFLLFLYICLGFDFSRALLLPALGVLVLLCHLYLKRRSGAFNLFWMSREGEEKSHTGKLRILILKAELDPSAFDPLPPPESSGRLKSPSNSEKDAPTSTSLGSPSKSDNTAESSAIVQLPNLYVSVDYIPHVAGYGLFWDQHYIGRTSTAVKSLKASWMQEEAAPAAIGNGAKTVESKDNSNLSNKTEGGANESGAESQRRSLGDVWNNIKNHKVFLNTNFRPGPRVSLHTWDQGDGNANPNCFKLKLPQPGKMVNGTFDQLPWSQSPAEFRFAVCHEPALFEATDKRKSNILGEATVPFRKLVSDDYRGGPQRVYHEWLDVCDVTPDPATGQRRITGRVLVRIQLRLWSRDDEISQDAFLHDGVEDKKARDDPAGKNQQSIFDTYRQIKVVSRNIQNLLGQVCGVVESAKNLLNWTHPWKTELIFVAVLLGVIITFLVPSYQIILIAGVYGFLKRLLFPGDAGNKPLENLLYSVPNDKELQQVFNRRRSILEWNTKLETKLTECPLLGGVCFASYMMRLEKSNQSSLAASSASASTGSSHFSTTALTNMMLKPDWNRRIILLTMTTPEPSPPGRAASLASTSARSGSLLSSLPWTSQTKSGETQAKLLLENGSAAPPPERTSQGSRNSLDLENRPKLIMLKSQEELESGKFTVSEDNFLYVDPMKTLEQNPSISLPNLPEKQHVVRVWGRTRSGTPTEWYLSALSHSDLTAFIETVLNAVTSMQPPSSSGAGARAQHGARAQASGTARAYGRSQSSLPLPPERVRSFWAEWWIMSKSNKDKTHLKKRETRISSENEPVNMPTPPQEARQGGGADGLRRRNPRASLDPESEPVNEPSPDQKLEHQSPVRANPPNEREETASTTESTSKADGSEKEPEDLVYRGSEGSEIV